MTVLTQWQPTYVRPDVRPEPRKPRPVPRQRVASPVEFHLNLALIRHRRQESILREHRPTRRRFRVVRFAGFPIPALVTRCHCCNAIWPCRELITVLRHRYGWTRKLDRALALVRKNVELTPSALDDHP
ncbi:hypothetical protein AB0I28_22680 [Phytomonospora sp. NPDC050363]|uniref:hypothetical protein n=1 Tax=Phytomonospora sp. NPDC050363 TaxID=3155642 RepID=UPI0033E96582